LSRRRAVASEATAERAQAVADADDAHAMAVDHGLAADAQAELGQIGAVDDDTVRFFELGAELGRQHVGEQQAIRPRIDARHEHRDAAAVDGAAPVAIDPAERLHALDVGIHHQPDLDIIRNRPAELDALRAGVTDPEIAARFADIDRRAVEDAEHERGLHQQQEARKRDGEHRRQEPAPFVQERLARERNHQAGGSADGIGAPPSAL
jgi:hypothetical protein